MNNSYQAKNGFKTFLVTLVISLGVFGLVYYLTSYPTYEVDIESSTGGESVGVVESAKSDLVSDDPVKVEKSPFGELNTQTPDVPRRTVLAGADTTEETTESTTPVPDTGMMGMTVSLFASLLVLAGGLYYIYLGPRSLALKSFEDRFLS